MRLRRSCSGNRTRRPPPLSERGTQQVHQTRCTLNVLFQNHTQCHPFSHLLKSDILYIRQFRLEFRMPELDRITQDPAVMGGKPCIRGMRVTVGMVVGQIGAGRSIEDVLADYPYLEREDILQALRYAAWRAEEREVALPRG
jgi:uncharacterized protein (DUF433 family)